MEGGETLAALGRWSDDFAPWHHDLVALWRRKKGEYRLLPARRDFEMNDLRPWLGWLHLVEVLPDGDYLWRIYATKVGLIYKREWTGKRFSEVPHRNPLLLMSWYADCVALRRPLEHTDRVDNEGRLIPWSRLFLPLGDDGVRVDRILVHSYRTDIER